MQALANNRDIFWQDKRAYLNQALKKQRASCLAKNHFFCYRWITFMESI